MRDVLQIEEYLEWADQQAADWKSALAGAAAGGRLLDEHKRAAELAEGRMGISVDNGTLIDYFRRGHNVSVPRASATKHDLCWDENAQALDCTWAALICPAILTRQAKHMDLLCRVG